MQRVLVAALLSLTCCVLSVGPARAADRDGNRVFDDLETQLVRQDELPVVVTLRVPVTQERLHAIEEAVDGLDPSKRLNIVDAFTARANREQIRALAARADVAHVELDAPVVPFSVGALNASGVTAAQTDIPGLDGEGTVAAVIDSGIDQTMPDLSGTKVVGFQDLVNGRVNAYDDLGHGSMVSDVLAGTGAGGAEGRGVAPKASLVGVKVIDRAGQSSLSLIAQGIQWAVDNRARYGIDVINLSIGDPNGCGDGTDVASRAVDAAVAAGILVVAAAGNSGPGNCTIKAPGAAESALTVGAMADPRSAASTQGAFSSRGPTADGRTKPDISAPGVDVTMANPRDGYFTGSGTSFAAPLVAGAALLLLQVDPTLTPARIKDVVEGTAIDWGKTGRDFEYGSGRLDVYAALRAVGAPLAVPPAVPSHDSWTDTLSAGGQREHSIDVDGAPFPLALTMTAATSDIDLTLIGPDGAELSPATRSERQETIVVKAPAAGRYVARVRGGDGTFTVDVSAALAPTDVSAPALTLESPPATSDSTPTLQGQAGAAVSDFPGVVVRIRRGGEIVRRLASTPALGRWSVDVAPSLEDGDYTVDVEQGDAAGNVARIVGRAHHGRHGCSGRARHRRRGRHAANARRDAWRDG